MENTDQVLGFTCIAVLRERPDDPHQRPSRPKVRTIRTRSVSSGEKGSHGVVLLFPESFYAFRKEQRSNLCLSQ